MSRLCVQKRQAIVAMPQTKRNFNIRLVLAAIKKPPRICVLINLSSAQNRTESMSGVSKALEVCIRFGEVSCFLCSVTNPCGISLGRTRFKRSTIL